MYITVGMLLLPARSLLCCTVHFMLSMQMSPVTFKCLYTQLTTTATLTHGQSGLGTAK